MYSFGIVPRGRRGHDLDALQIVREEFVAEVLRRAVLRPEPRALTSDDDDRTYRTPHPCGEGDFFGRYIPIGCQNWASDQQTLLGGDQLIPVAASPLRTGSAANQRELIADRPGPRGRDHEPLPTS